MLGSGASAAGSTTGAVGGLLTAGGNAAATVVNAVGTTLGAAPGLSVSTHSNGTSAANNPLAPVSSLIQSLTGGLSK
ncbi:hypothetical protein BURMUCF1_0546 [Burkholderia multivorans ATCC BAA-247]|nr:hypothetical protein BURMUCF1_0546 [Burkholderia multivorans ATCC BAA-247]